MSQEQLWTKNPSVLFMPGSFQRFVPTKDMDIPTSLNAIVRFTIYFSILLYAGTSKKEYLWSIPFVLLSTMIFAYLFPTQRDLVETFTLLNSAPSLIPEKVYTMPTPDNPFMNPLLTEIQDNPNRPDAAPITSKQTKKEIEIPKLLKNALAKNKLAKQNFDKMAFTYRKEYVNHIESAKRETTKISRLEKVILNLENNIKMHEQYKC